ncbi:uncharacterized protein [Linepithema humile]|nr:PREDICTED: uncharacterized protein LOC105669270 isoform X2 [Linepithema humile]
MTSKLCNIYFMEEEVVPNFWIREPVGTSQWQWPHAPFVAKSIIPRTIPHQNWPIYKCRVLGTFEMTSKFCIIYFMEEETVEVVPDFWIRESGGTFQCQWPNTSFPAKNVVRRTIPHQNWPTYKCRVLGTFDAEISSDFPSKNVKILGKRLHKRNPRYFDDDDSSSSTHDAVNTKKKRKGFLYSSATKPSTYVSDSSSSSNEEKENREPQKSNVQLPKAFEDKYKRVQKAILNEASTKRSVTLSTKLPFSSPQNHRKDDEDNTRLGCSMWDNLQREKRAEPLTTKIKFQSTCIGETGKIFNYFDTINSYIDQTLVKLINDYSVANMTNKTHFTLEKKEKNDYISRNVIGNTES